MTQALDVIPRRLRPMASVFCEGDEQAWAVAQTPSEVAELVRKGLSERTPLIELTLANNSDWNGRIAYVKPGTVNGIAPPLDSMISEFEG